MQIDAKYVFRFFLILGCVLTAIGVYNLCISIEFVAEAQFVSGVVEGFNEEPLPDSSLDRSLIMPRPIVRFRSAEGNEIIFTPRSSSTSTKIQQGDMVGVYYLPQDPKNSARLDSFADLWVLSTVFLSLGLFVCCLCGFVWYFSTKKKPGPINLRMTKKPNSGNFESLLFIFFWLGIACVGGAASWITTISVGTGSSIRTDGKVVSFMSEGREHRGENVIISPVVEFITLEGEKIRFTANYKTTDTNFHTGDIVDVYYDRDDPRDNPFLDNFYTRWLAPLILLGIGFIFCLIYLIPRFIINRQRRKNRLNYRPKVTPKDDPPEMWRV